MHDPLTHCQFWWPAVTHLKIERPKVKDTAQRCDRKLAISSAYELQTWYTNGVRWAVSPTCAVTSNTWKLRVQVQVQVITSLVGGEGILWAHYRPHSTNFLHNDAFSTCDAMPEHTVNGIHRRRFCRPYTSMRDMLFVQVATDVTVRSVRSTSCCWERTDKKCRTTTIAIAFNNTLILNCETVPVLRTKETRSLWNFKNLQEHTENANIPWENININIIINNIFLYIAQTPTVRP